MATYTPSGSLTGASDSNAVITVFGNASSGIPGQNATVSIVDINDSGQQTTVVSGLSVNGAFNTSFDSSVLTPGSDVRLEAIISNGSSSVTSNELDTGFAAGVTTAPGTNNAASPTEIAPNSATPTYTTSSSVTVDGADGSTIDFSGTTVDASGQPIGLNVTVLAGANTVKLNNGPSVVQSINSDDTILSGGGQDTLSSGFGQDSLVGGGQSLLLGGQEYGDTLRGGLTAESHDTIYAGQGGYDVIYAQHGHNIINGSTAGHDTIFAGNSQDAIYAVAGGPEVIHGGAGAVVHSNGLSIMDNGNHDIYNLTGADTVFGSAHHNTVNILGGSDGVLVDGRTGATGSLNVNVRTTDPGNDTLFGSVGADGNSNLNVHVSQAYTVDPNATTAADGSVLHTVQLAGGQTLHVSNVNIIFDGKTTSVS